MTHPDFSYILKNTLLRLFLNGCLHMTKRQHHPQRQTTTETNINIPFLLLLCFREESLATVAVAAAAYTVCAAGCRRSRRRSGRAPVRAVQFGGCTQGTERES